MFNTAHVIRTCIRCNTPCMLENPMQSLMWSAPAISRLVFKDSCQSVLLDQCQFGTRWHKRTRIAAWNCIDISSLARLCTGKKGVCSKTSIKHIVLTGRIAHSNKLWTSIAQEYPRELSQCLASCLVESVQANRFLLHSSLLRPRV